MFAKIAVLNENELETGVPIYVLQAIEHRKALVPVDIIHKEINSFIFRNVGASAGRWAGGTVGGAGTRQVRYR